MGMVASQITRLAIVYSIVYSGSYCAGISAVIGEFPAQMTSNAKNVCLFDDIIMLHLR